MSALLDSFRKNAEAAHAEAQTASLANVRERAARAAAVWEEMIQRQEGMENRKRP